MKRWTRREFGIAAGTAGLTLAPRMGRSQVKPRVVVVGGGVGGATVARYLAMTTKAIDVTLVEPKTQYTTCFLSNLYLAGLRSLESLTKGYEFLSERHGIKVIHEAAANVDPASKRVALASGTTLPYDRLVVSPGIAFKYGAIEGYDEAATRDIPHAWNAGAQTRLLRDQLQLMEDGGTFVIGAPPEPYRCPPGPYERASLAAYYFKQFKPRSKILILDAKDSFFEQELFQEGWDRHYPGMIEWLPAQFTGGIRSIEVASRAVTTAGETYRASVVNIIPPQIAGDLAQKIGLADASGWCPVDPVTFESKLQANIHVVGDAAHAGDMPKSAFCANSQGKACAVGIAAALTGLDRGESHLFNTCYTYLAADDAVSDAISFKPHEGEIKLDRIFMSKLGESPDVRRQTIREAGAWYDAFTKDVFG